jgi:hypothetical protein
MRLFVMRTASEKSTQLLKGSSYSGRKYWQNFGGGSGNRPQTCLSPDTNGTGASNVRGGLATLSPPGVQLLLHVERSYGHSPVRVSLRAPLHRPLPRSPQWRLVGDSTLTAAAPLASVSFRIERIATYSRNAHYLNH